MSFGLWTCSISVESNPRFLSTAATSTIEAVSIPPIMITLTILLPFLRSFGKAFIGILAFLPLVFQSYRPDQ
jgi:hypothetical protein